jgi:hypothetical protein
MIAQASQYTTKRQIDQDVQESLLDRAQHTPDSMIPYVHTEDRRQ